MDIKEKREKYRLTIAAILNNELFMAFENINTLATAIGKQQVVTQLEQQETIYRKMLSFYADNIEDPQRITIRDNIKKALFSLADLTFSASLSADENSVFYKNRIQHPNDNILKSNLIEDLSGNFSNGNHSDFKEAENQLNKLFLNIWMKERLSDDDLEEILIALNNNNITIGIKSILISAVTLHLLDKFSPKGMMFLLDVYENQQNELWQRGLIGFLLLSIRFDARMGIYPEIQGRLTAMVERDAFINHLKQAAIQLIRTGDTEKINKKINEEIFPEVMKIAPKIREKLNLDQLMNETTDEDKNPDWEDMFSDHPGLYNKLEELNKLQSEGADVFIAAFSQLKNFSFFNTIVNWFLPFYPGHPDLNNIDTTDATTINYSKFLDIYGKSPVMCNSDKYSFCINLISMPNQQKEMLLNALSNEMEEMNKINEDDEMLKDAEGQAVFHQYMQDIYRFFKLHPARQETLDPFSTKKQLYQTRMMLPLFQQSDDLTRHVAEYYFSHDHYSHALDMFSLLEDQPQENPELFQKMGYAYQMLERYEEAIVYYKKAELFNTHSSWNLKKIARCYLLLNDAEKAISNYQMAEKQEPESIRLKLTIGNIYLENSDFENALIYYRQAEELRPSDIKTFRPVAWCLLLKGETKAAEMYYEQILEKETTPYDLMNAGHVELVKGNRKNAIAFYLESIKNRKKGFVDFYDAYSDDRLHLERIGVAPDELSFMIEALRDHL